MIYVERNYNKRLKSSIINEHYLKFKKYLHNDHIIYVFFGKNGYKEKKIISWYDNGIKSHEYFPENKKSITWHYNGIKETERFFKDDVMDGLCRSWYENGKIKQISSYKKGELDGKLIAFYKTGGKKYEQVYKDGTLIKNGPIFSSLVSKRY
jgi:antitoxin component YwqK of YwqJK toxin-antitoxin module